MVVTVPVFLVVGHITRDLVGQSYQPGGTAFYAALTAARLGLRVAVFTAVEVEMESVLTLPRIQVFNVAASCTTVFENVYEGEARTQYLHSM